MRELFIDVAGIRISALYRGGIRAAVVLVHGNSSCKEIFRNQIDVLSEAGFSVLIPDLPGHGRSGDAKAPRDIYSFPGYAKILIELLDSCGIEECHIVGWSLGGHIGLELWQRFDRVRSLLLSGTPPIELSPDGVARGFVASPVMDLAGTRDFGPNEVIAYGSAMLGRKLTRDVPLAQMIARTDGEARLDQFSLLGLGQYPDLWHQWLNREECLETKKNSYVCYDDFFVLYEAAVGGAGIAIGIDIMVDSYLGQGRLVRISPIEHPSREKIYALRNTSSSRTTPAFLSWLREEAEQWRIQHRTPAGDAAA